MRFDELGENPADALGMHEPDQGAVRPGTGHFIEQLPARGRRLGKRGADVTGRKGDMVNGLTTVTEELLDRRLGVQWRDQLDPAFSDGDHGDLDTLILEPLSATGPKPEPPLIHLDRLVEIAHGDPHMIDPGQHWLILRAAFDGSRFGGQIGGLTSCAPFVVGFNTASYITRGLPLCTQGSERPAVGGASDPTEGRRLDPDPHRWRNAASHRRGRRDRRPRPGSAVEGAALIGRGVYRGDRASRLGTS